MGSDANEDACADEMLAATEEKVGLPKEPWMVRMVWDGTTMAIVMGALGYN